MEGKTRSQRDALQEEGMVHHARGGSTELKKNTQKERKQCKGHDDFENRFRKIMQQQPDGRSLSKTQVNFEESIEVKELETVDQRHCFFKWTTLKKGQGAGS